MRLIFLIFLFLAGCATQPIPMPAPACDMTVGGECREMSSSEKGGAVVRGHGQESKDVKP